MIRINEHVYARADFRCEYCGRDLLTNVDHFMMATRDHFLPRTQGGGNSIDNLVSCCVTCNRIKGPKRFKTFEDAQAYILGQRKHVAAWLRFVRSQARYDHKARPRPSVNRRSSAASRVSRER